MEKLNPDWLTGGLVDFEYKKYILLSYLKDVKKRFQQFYLYPFMADLIYHYRNLLSLKDKKYLINKNFPKTLTKADFKQWRLFYKKLINDDDIMQLVDELIAFAVPLLKNTLDEGKELYDFVEENIELDTVGVVPLYNDEGYLLVHLDAKSEVLIYRYHLTLFEKSEEKYKSISTTFLYEEMKSLSCTYESMKKNLLQNFKDLVNPATFVAECKLEVSVHATVLPIVKRMLAKTISS